MTPDVALTTGSVTPVDSIGPCGQCGQPVFEVVHRWVAVKDPQNNPAEMELVSRQCPRCCWVRSGVNQHGRKERRTRLHWVDQRTGRPIPLAGYSLAGSPATEIAAPVMQDDDCPAWAFDPSLSVPSAATRPGAAAPAAGKPEGPRPARQASLLEIDR